MSRSIPLALMGALALSGCAFIPGMSSSNKKLVEVASFDFDCPEDQIEVVSKNDGYGSGQYVLNVCGTERRYKRTGTVYHRADVSPVPTQ